MEKSKKDKIKDFGLRFTSSLLSMLLAYKLSANIQSLINHKAVIEYRKVISDFADLLKEEGYTEPSEIFDCYNYALWNGYLSNNHELYYNMNRKIYLSYAGLGCIEGNGVCLNYASMLSDIYDELGYNSYPIMCYVDLNDFKLDIIGSNKSIKRNVKDSNNNIVIEKICDTLMNVAGPILGNHCVTCVRYEDEYYYYDPTNLIYLEKKGIGNLNIINGKGTFKTNYFTTELVGELTTTSYILNKTNNEEYSNYILSRPNTNIPVNELESFYQKEKGKYNDITTYTDSFFNDNIIALAIGNSLYSVIETIACNQVRDIETKIKTKRKKLTKIKKINC